MFKKRQFPSLLIRTAALAAIVFTVYMPLAATSNAQRNIDVAPAVQENEAAAPVEEQSLFGILRQGGVVMIPILLCSFVTLVFVFERFISLRRGRVIPAPFVKKLLHQLREGKLDKEQALALCDENGSPAAEVFAGALRRWGRPTVELEQAVLDAQERVAIGLRRYVKLFSAVANVAPLLGLLGTVLGIMQMFREISDAEAMDRVSRMTHGISEALMTTAGGLCVAIPALCFYVFFCSRVERLCHLLDLVGQELVGLVSAEALAETKATRTVRKSAAAA